jgi:large subunit ribosomal protein L13
MKKHPTRMLEYAIKGMLPKSRLGNAIFRNLYLYAGPEHQHEAQKPKLIDLKTIK